MGRERSPGAWCLRPVSRCFHSMPAIAGSIAPGDLWALEVWTPWYEERRTVFERTIERPGVPEASDSVGKAGYENSLDDPMRWSAPFSRVRVPLG